MQVWQEHPDSLGPSNKVALDATSRAYYAARSLASRGLIVEGIRTVKSQAVITVRPTPRCDILESFTFKRGHDAHGRYIVRAAVVEGCDVHWEIRSAA